MNKRITGNYRCVNDTSNFTIRVHLWEIRNESIVDNAEVVEVETRDFRWQEKRFGKSERDFYKDPKNCVTDLDRKYHEELKRNRDNDGFLYSYCNDDEFCRYEESVCTSRFKSELAKQVTIGDRFEVMHLMVDFGEYLDETWIKHEYILCTIKFAKETKLLTVFPDFTIFEPYRLTVDGDITKIYEYTIENVSEGIFETENEILNKIADHERKLKRFNTFTLPPKGKTHLFLFLEISKGRNFENDNVYVRFLVDLPDGWSCSDRNHLKGSTQTCRVRSADKTLFFGATFEMILSVESGKWSDGPYVYFEATSKDTFDRYRVEGTSYLKLPIQSGIYRRKMRCSRILPDGIPSRLRRVFIGDYPGYEDASWFAVPKGYKEPIINKQGVTTVETGEIEVKLHVLRQFPTDDFPNRRETLISEKLGSSTLAKSVEEVIDAFKRARARMLEVREKEI